MAKQTGKKFKMPNPLFGKGAYEKLAAVAVDQYRKITFDVNNPRMANKKKFPKYSKPYQKRKESNLLSGQDSSYKNSTAPVVRGALWEDTQGDYSVKQNSIYIGWNAEANKIDWLRDNGRILTSKQYPVNPDVVKKMMPQLNKELKKSMPKGTNTITIGKKK
jgi:hypothetical protein